MALVTDGSSALVTTASQARQQQLEWTAQDEETRDGLHDDQEATVGVKLESSSNNQQAEPNEDEPHQTSTLGPRSPSTAADHSRVRGQKNRADDDLDHLGPDQRLDHDDEGARRSPLREAVGHAHQSARAQHLTRAQLVRMGIAQAAGDAETSANGHTRDYDADRDDEQDDSPWPWTKAAPCGIQPLVAELVAVAVGLLIDYSAVRALAAT